ncbi:MAG: septum formation initiator family protein [Lachnospiraceae bacterium]|nr:septum formation initiator family protein [Lachnospiraceae bacterium]
MARTVRKEKKKRTGLLIIAVIVMMLCGVILYQKQQKLAERARYEQQIAELNARIDDLHEEAEEIEDYKAYVQTKKYVEEIARERLGLVYENEIIFEGH